MKNRRYSQSTERNWFRMLLYLILIIAISCFAFGIFLYQDIYKKKIDGFDKTEEEIINQTSITKVEHIERFHGDEGYLIVYGVNENNEERIIFYPIEGSEKSITSVKTSEIIPKEEILSSWNASCKNCKLVKITPALIEGNILWELTYYDKNDRYVLDYVSIYDGSNYEQYRFKRMFN